MEKKTFPEIAEVIEDVSRRAMASKRLIRGKSRAACQACWMEVESAHNATDFPGLMVSLTETMGRSTDALARLEKLQTWPRDSRTLELALAQLEVPAFHSSSTKRFWQRLIQLVVEHGDPRGGEQLEGLADRMESILGNRHTDRSAVARWFSRN